MRLARGVRRPAGCVWETVRNETLPTATGTVALPNHFSAMTRMGTVMVLRGLTADASGRFLHESTIRHRATLEAADGFCRERAGCPDGVFPARE